MSNGKSYSILASVLFLLFSFITEGALAQEFSYAHATVIAPKGVSIPVEVSDTPEKRSLGLGKRDKLENGWGMLFVFEKQIPHSFWMKNMRFPIDIIWLDNQRIVELAENVPPPQEGESPKVMEPHLPSNFVLELESGRSRALGLKVGQKLSYQF